MTRWIAGLALLTLAPFDAAAHDPQTALARKKGWLTDLEAGRQAARREGKPLLVVFRCGP